LTEPFISDLLYISGAKRQSSIGEKMVKDYFGGAVGALSILSGIHYISVELLAENEELLALISGGANLKELSDFVAENY
jgi:hypothetical protein